jgi:hypothetical protein
LMVLMLFSLIILLIFNIYQSDLDFYYSLYIVLIYLMK